MAHSPNKPLTVLQKPPKALEDSNEELYEYLNALVTRLERTLTYLSRAKATGWQPTNVPATGNRDLDADAGTLQETSRSLVRLIQDLKDGGLIAP